MATRSEMTNSIEGTRTHISNLIDEISGTVHKRMDWHERVRENPTGAVLAALGVGFVLATISTPIGRVLLRFGARSAFAALGAYASKQGVNYITNKIKSR